MEVPIDLCLKGPSGPSGERGDEGLPGQRVGTTIFRFIHFTSISSLCEFVVFSCTN